MGCSRHPCWRRGIGVCASCLREKLVALIEAQAREERRKSYTPPHPPAFFPRSVSPYICRHSDASIPPQFYSTPQIGPTFAEKEAKRKKEKKSRFSLLSSLFRSGESHEMERDPRVSTAPIASTSWFPAFRTKKSRLFSLDDEIYTSAERRPRPTRQVRDRGMSPNSEWEEQNQLEPGSSPGRRKPGPIRRSSKHAHVRDMSGFTFRLNPLVRASPNRFNRSDLGFANRSHLSTAGSLPANRSKKLADLGRYP